MGRFILLTFYMLLFFSGCAETNAGTLFAAPVASEAEQPPADSKASAAPPVQEPPPRPAFRYGRSFLVEEQAVLYDRLSALFSTPAPESAIPVEGGMTDDGVIYTINTFLRENPLYYWAELSLAAGEEGRHVLLTYKLAPEEVARRQREIEARAAEILAPVKEAPPFEAALAIHDAVAVIPYDRHEATPDHGNIYGALVQGAASCSGYASGFQYLAELAGLDSVFLIGESMRGIPHAWNAVRLDGSWHFVDCTWNRPLGEFDDVYHDYFLIDAGLLLAERRWDETQYPAMPQPSEGFRDYYRRIGYAVSGDVPGNAPDLLAGIFYRQLAAKPSFPANARPVFLEFRVSDSPEVYEQWKSIYIKQLFNILRAIQKKTGEERAGFVIDDLLSVACDYNDTTQVFTFYPIIRQED